MCAITRYIDTLTTRYWPPVRSGNVGANITAVVKMPIAGSRARGTRCTNPPSRHTQDGLVEETKGAPEKSICLPDGEAGGEPRPVKVSARLRVSQPESIDPRDVEPGEATLARSSAIKVRTDARKIRARGITFAAGRPGKTATRKRRVRTPVSYKPEALRGWALSLYLFPRRFTIWLSRAAM